MTAVDTVALDALDIVPDQLECLRNSRNVLEIFRKPLTRHRVRPTLLASTDPPPIRATARRAPPPST
ncbi:hypothetical protein, partial [Actinomadura sp. GC306]|uniref:hypothetical protein n=1 Tax=Actinomadura sp. GC306 TaxID=2530367 RepID=UPI001A9D5C94